jgi:hypothetical protein
MFISAQSQTLTQYPLTRCNTDIFPSITMNQNIHYVKQDANVMSINTLKRSCVL